MRSPRARASWRASSGICRRAPGVPWNQKTACPSGVPNSATPSLRPSRTRTVPSSRAGVIPPTDGGYVPVMAKVPYDELGLFHENAAEFGLPYDGPPVVRRESVEVAPGRRLSALVWGATAPELVLLHGGAQNAHTWDTVAMALGRPLVAIDLPGHGHSDAPADGALGLRANAADVAATIAVL